MNMMRSVFSSVLAVLLMGSLIFLPPVADAGQSTGRESNVKDSAEEKEKEGEQKVEEKEGGELLKEEFDELKDSDYPDLVGKDETGDIMHEFAFLEEEYDVVVAASKHKQKVGFSPSAVIVITLREIEATGATTLAELLRRYPAVHVYEFGPLYPTAEIRGNYQIMMLLDGREVNFELFPTPFYSLLPVGLQEVERIEIVMGPNSSLYGANAVSAVINVVTQKPEVGLHADAFFTAGEHGTTIVQGHLGGGAGPVSFSGSGGIERADSWTGQDVQEKDIIRAHGRGRLELPGGSLSADGGMVWAAGRVFAVLGYLETSGMLLTHMRSSLELGDLKTNVYWYRAQGDLDPDLKLVYPSLGLELGTVPVIEMTLDTLHGEVQYDLELFEGNLMIVGADYRFTRFHSQQIVEPTVDEHRMSIYVHDEQRLFRKLVFTLGTRLDWNTRTDLAFSPRGAVVCNLSGEHYLRLSSGTAFRKPTIIETNANFHVDASPAFPELRVLFEEKGLSNPNLGNEKFTTVELGYRGALLDRQLRLGADAWLAFNRNHIGFKTDIHFDQTMMGPRINIDESTLGYYTMHERDTNSCGIHLSAEGEPTEELTLFVRCDLRHTWYVGDGRTNVFFPRILISTGATLELPLGVIAELKYLHVGNRRARMPNPYSILDEQYSIYLPARNYVFASVSYSLELGRSRLKLGLSLFNAFGARQREDPGLTTTNGENYGAELIGPRAMLTARFMY